MVEKSLSISIFDEIVEEVQKYKLRADRKLRLPNPANKKQEILVASMESVMESINKLLASHDCLQHLISQPQSNYNQLHPQDLSDGQYKVLKLEILESLDKSHQQTESNQEGAQEFAQSLLEEINKNFDQRLDKILTQTQEHQRQLEEFHVSSKEKAANNNLQAKQMQDDASLIQIYQKMNDQFEKLDESIKKLDTSAQMKTIVDNLEMQSAIIASQINKQITFLIMEFKDELDKHFRMEIKNSQFALISMNMLQIIAQLQNSAKSCNKIPKLSSEAPISNAPNELNHGASIIAAGKIDPLPENEKILINQKYFTLAHSYQDDGVGDLNLGIFRTASGKFIVYNRSSYFQIYSKDLSFQAKIDTQDPIRSGIAISNKIFCAQNDCKLKIYDEDTLKLIKTLKQQKVCSNMLQLENDFLLLAEEEGYIEIIQISTLTIVLKKQLSWQSNINNIVKTTSQYEYAVAHLQGLNFINIQKMNGKFIVTENQKEEYFPGQLVYSVAEISSHVFAACIISEQHLQVVDRKLKSVVGDIKSNSLNGQYNCLMQVEGYDKEKFPYLLLKDSNKISLINTKTMKVYDLIEFKFGYYIPHSMIQFKENNLLQMVSLFNEGESLSKIKRTIKQFTIQKE